MILFSGTSNRPLAEKISKELTIPLGNVEITRFIDSECRVYFRENDVKDKSVVVVQSLSQIADQHLVELCLMGQALKSMKAGKLTAVIPWMGYSKQDKEFRKGEAVSAHLVAKFIETAGFDHVITVELHSENITPFFTIPVTEVHTSDLLSSHIQVTKQTVVVSPDQGGQSRSDAFAKQIGVPVVHLEKERDKASGNVVVTKIQGSVDHAHAIIFDDIINTGATAIQTSTYLMNSGALSVTFLATHPVFAGSAHTKLGKSSISNVIVTDTIEVPIGKQFTKLTTVSVAPLLAEAIQQIKQ